MKDIDLREQYRTMIREEIKSRKYIADQYMILLGVAGGIAMEECYTDTERGKRLRILFQVWEEEHK